MFAKITITLNPIHFVKQSDNMSRSENVFDFSNEVFIK